MNPPRSAVSRLNVNLDRGLHRALKRQALDEDTDVAAIVRRLIEGYLSAVDLVLAHESPPSASTPIRAGLPTAPPVRRQ